MSFIRNVNASQSRKQTLHIAIHGPRACVFSDRLPAKVHEVRLAVRAAGWSTEAAREPSQQTVEQGEHQHEQSKHEPEVASAHLPEVYPAQATQHGLGLVDANVDHGAVIERRPEHLVSHTAHAARGRYSEPIKIEHLRYKYTFICQVLTYFKKNVQRYRWYLQFNIVDVKAN